MKKFISFALVLVLCLGLFAGCAGNGEDTTPSTSGSTQTAENPLKSAVEYLEVMYKPAVKGEPTKITTDKEVLSVVMIDGVSYKVEWTVKVTSGPEDAVTISAASTANMVKIDIMDDPEVELAYTATATVSDGVNETQSVSFDFVTPAKVKVEVSEGKVVLYHPGDGKYATAEEYLYTSSSGSTKNELVLSESKSDAVVFTVRENADKSVTFITDSGKYLYCDGSNVGFLDAENEYTIFYLESAENGQYIKSNACYNNDPAKPQYLEIYSGYLTCYSMNDSKADLYTFELQAVSSASQSSILDAAYAIGAGEALDGTYTLTGVITKIDTAWSAEYKNITVTMVCDGDTARPMMCYRLKGDSAEYLAVGDTITVTGTIKNYNGTVEFDAACTLDKVVKGEGNEVPDEPVTPDVPVENPTYLTSAPETGKAYKLGLEQKGLSKNLYFTGNIYKTYAWYMDTTDAIDSAIEVYVEAVDGGYRLYFTKDGAKTYLDAHIDGTHYSLRLIDAPTAVWTWNAEYNTFVVDLDGTVCFIGTSGTYTSLSCNKMEDMATSYPAHLYN